MKIIYEIREGVMYPRFHLPIKKCYNKRCIQTTFFLIAPFILFFEITKNILLMLYHDLLDYRDLTSPKES